MLVVGAGDATGGAIARRFARGGYTACVTRRTADKLQPLVQRIRAEGGRAEAFASDARREEEVTALFERVEAEQGPVEVVVEALAPGDVVWLRGRNGRGKLVIQYHSLDELDGILERIR